MFQLKDKHWKILKYI